MVRRRASSLISNVTGRPFDARRAARRSVLAPACSPARAVSAGVAALRELGVEAFVEIGPSPTLLGMARACLPQADADWLPSLRRGRDDRAVMLDSLGALYARGAAIDWTADADGRTVDLPTYPFERQRYWVSPAAAKRPSPHGQVIHCLAPRSDHPCTRHRLRLRAEPARTRSILADHRVYGTVLFPGTGYRRAGAGSREQLRQRSTHHRGPEHPEAAGAERRSPQGAGRRHARNTRRGEPPHREPGRGGASSRRR